MTGPRIKANPVTDSRWWHKAACYPDHDLFDSTHPDDMRDARAMCNGWCPVSGECLEDALTREAEPGAVRYGIRGGLDPNERAALSRKRPGFAPKPINHGTYGGYVAHKRRGEDPCASCREGYRQYQRDKRAKDAARKRAAREKASA